MTENEKDLLRLREKTKQSEKLTQQLADYIYFKGPIQSASEAQAALAVRNELNEEIEILKEKISIKQLTA